ACPLTSQVESIHADSRPLHRGVLAGSAKSAPSPCQGDEFEKRRREPMNISIFGLGYVGAVSLACLARDGHQVIGVDIDASKLDLIRRGRSPVIEEGLPALMEQVVESGRLHLTANATFP